MEYLIVGLIVVALIGVAIVAYVVPTRRRAAPAPPPPPETTGEPQLRAGTAPTIETPRPPPPDAATAAEPEVLPPVELPEIPVLERPERTAGR